jgi:hypothetical protein
MKNFPNKYGILSNYIEEYVKHTLSMRRFNDYNERIFKNIFYVQENNSYYINENYLSIENKIYFDTIMDLIPSYTERNESTYI